MEDKYGYLKLKSTLEIIAEKLIQENQQALANEVARATKFYGGMPSEFMGESWLALKKILGNKQKLSDDTVILVEDIYKQIEKGFERIGQKLPK